MIPIHMHISHPVTVPILRLFQSWNCYIDVTIPIMRLYNHVTVQIMKLCNLVTVPIVTAPNMRLLQLWDRSNHEDVTIIFMWLFQSWDCYNHVTVPIMRLLHSCDCSNHEVFTIMWLLQSWCLTGMRLYQFFIDFPVIILFLNHETVPKRHSANSGNVSIMILFQSCACSYNDCVPVARLFQSWDSSKKENFSQSVAFSKINTVHGMAIFDHIIF